MNECNNNVPAVIIGGLLLMLVAGANAWAMLIASACGTAALFVTCRGAKLRRGLLIVLIASGAAAATLAFIARGVR